MGEKCLVVPGRVRLSQEIQVIAERSIVSLILSRSTLRYKEVKQVTQQVTGIRIHVS